MKNRSYKTLTDAKPLCIRFNKMDGLIRVYDENRYLVLLGSEKYYFIYNKIRHLIEVKNGITYAISHNDAKIQVDSQYSLLLEKQWHFITFDNTKKILVLW